MARSVSDIQSDLDAARAARLRLLGTGEEYSMDSGQGRMSSKLSLSTLNQTIRDLEAELLDASSDGNTFAPTFDRGGW